MVFSKLNASKSIPLRVNRFLFFLVIAGACAWTTLGWGQVENQAQPLQINAEESIVFIGNTFAERLSLFGYFETVLHSKHPTHRLKIRNMGWPADEVALRPRPRAFGDLHRYLSEHEVDLIFACFGMNESFKGPEGLEVFRRDLDAFIDDLQGHQYNDQSAPRIVLVSPIAHENLGGDLPDGADHNKNLALYTQAMADAADRAGLRFMDLFTPTRELMRSSLETKLTFNGIHLTAYGDWTVSQMMARSLGLVETIAPPRAAGNPAAEGLRRTIYDKNYSFYFHWRGPNMEYIHGSRKRTPGAERIPEELVQLQGIIDQLDLKIWEMAKPKPEEVWQQAPAGRPMWADTPQYPDIDVPEITEVKIMEGHREEHEGERGILSLPQVLEALHLPDGYVINLYASEEKFPIANPMALNFDPEGRLWVANTPTWPQPHPGVQPTDSVVILEDTDRDGVADTHTVFVDNLNMIHGFALGDGGAYISQTPKIIHAKDTDGDNRADEFLTVLHGFGSEDIEHSINNYKWGPDGALYFMEGVFFHTQVETPYGPRRIRNAGVLRYEPRTQKFDVFVSHPFADPWGQVFDRWGQSIILDASSHQYYNMDVLSANFVYPKEKRNRSRNLSFAPDYLNVGAGIDIIRSRQFPDEVQGRFLANECAGPFRGTRWFEISEDGTTYKITLQEPGLLVSKDPNFRAIAMVIGPDGALYFADFYSTLFENTSHPKRAEGRDHSRGRIWRVVYEGRPLLEPPKIVGEPAPVLLDLLKAYENTTRHFARRELQERDAREVIPHLKTWIAALDPADPDHELHLLEALWIYQGLGVVEPILLKRVLQAKDYHARASATRVLRFQQDEIDDAIDLLEKMVEDEHPRVRLQAVLACGFSSSDRAESVALKATLRPMDAGLQHALDDTMDYFERARSGRE